MLYWGDLRVPEVDYVLRLPFALHDLWLIMYACLRITLLCCCLVPVALCAEVEIPLVCVGLEEFWDKTPWFGYALCDLVDPCVRGLWYTDV